MDSWPITHIRNFTTDQIMDRGFVIHCQGLYEPKKQKRAEVIEAALSIEGILDLVILDLLVGENEISRETLREHVLFPEFCNSHQKWKMFCRLTETYPLYVQKLSGEDFKSLKSNIKKLFDDRNKFAHGDLFVDGSDFEVYLRFFQDGTKWLCVTDGLVETLLEKAASIRTTLSDLHERYTLQAFKLADGFFFQKGEMKNASPQLQDTELA